jgi:hypothetical protein
MRQKNIIKMIVTLLENVTLLLELNPFHNKSYYPDYNSDANLSCSKMPSTSTKTDLTKENFKR